MHDVVNSVLGPQARAEWEEHCLELEIASFPQWKRACQLWNQPGWISKRISLAVESRAETARQQAFAPAVTTPTMAMPLDQPVCLPPTDLDLPTHVLTPESDGQQTSQGPSGEHTTEQLTPDTELVQPIAELSLPEDTSDIETVVTVVSSRRRASESHQSDGDEDPAAKDRARRSSAQ